MLEILIVYDWISKKSSCSAAVAATAYIVAHHKSSYMYMQGQRYVTS